MKLYSAALSANISMVADTQLRPSVLQVDFIQGTRRARAFDRKNQLRKVNQGAFKI
jgi:hypothetical protein